MTLSPKLPLQAAIEEFRASQLRVYRSQLGRLQRDASSAKEVIRDHVGRWLYELLQNADDAGATRVAVHFADSTIYFSDDGGGLPPTAVESLSGTHFSVKPSSAIGRKGLGFKAVYCVTQSPAIFSGGEGMLFDRSRAIEWMTVNGLPTKHVPFQWLPIWTSRGDEEATDRHLRDLNGFRTVVRLSAETTRQVSSAWTLLQSFAPHALLTFANVKNLDVRGPKGASFSLSIERNEKGVPVQVLDSRLSHGESWVVSRTKRDAPEDLLVTFEEGEDRDRARQVDLLVAVPLDEVGIAKPLPEYPYLHVYYPTVEPSPVRVLLHGAFLIKSDRTQIVPMGETPYNQWVGRELAAVLLKFAMERYSTSAPAAYLRLLMPGARMGQRSTGQLLWDLVLENAPTLLLLPDCKGELSLRLEAGYRLGFREQRRAARAILRGTPFAARLVHPDLESDVEASQTMSALNVRTIEPADVLACIRTDAERRAEDAEWLWSCWEWLAAWVGSSKDHLELVRDLKMIPCQRGLVSGSEASSATVTWRDPESGDTVPDWLPLRILEDWFRDRLLPLAADSPVRRLADQLSIVKPAVDTVLAAVGRAAKAYWDDKSGDPGRFIRLVLERGWHTGEERPSELAFCPVPCRRGTSRDITWAPAQDTYLGAEWGSNRLERVYKGISNVNWAAHLPKLGPREQMRSALDWLQVKSSPWVVKSNNPGEIASEHARIATHVRSHTSIGPVDPPTSLEHLDLSALPPAKCVELLLLLEEHWDTYYGAQATITARYAYYGNKSTRVPSRWWERVLSQCIPPLTGYALVGVPVEKSWLVSERMRKLSPLVPCFDLGAVRKIDRERLVQWLRTEVRIRENPEQLDDDEIEEIVGKRIPALVPESSCVERTRRERVARWYAEIVSVCRERKGRSLDLSRLPRLANRGSEWKYVVNEPVWLDDDHDASAAFRGRIWTLSMRRDLRAIATHVLGVRSLAEWKSQRPQWSDLAKEQLPTDVATGLRDLLNEVKPYLFVWLSHARSSQTSTTLRAQVHSLDIHYVTDLRLVVHLDGVDEPGVVPRAHAVDSGRLILDVARANESSLAKAIAEALDRSEADFFEILLRCANNEARERKLREDRNVAQAELEQYFGEWNEGEPEPPAEPTGTRGPGEIESAGRGAAPREPNVEAEGAPDPGGRQPERGKRASDIGRQAREESPREPLNLKDPAKVGIAEAGQGKRGSGSRGKAGSDGRSWEQPSLSEDERRLVEKASRRFAEAHLVGLGYEVQQMPFDNPGFDIRATKKDADVLLVEVKGHLAMASHVELTAREYGEYTRCLRASGERWELWNVEKLSNDWPGSVTLTRYDRIPEAALVGVRAFRIDLGACARVDDKKQEG